MKRVAWCFGVLCLLVTVSAYAGDAKTGGKDGKAAAKKEEVFVCAHCKTTSAKAGKCEKCKAEMMKADAVYACPKCGAEGKKGEKCDKCKAAMTKNAAVYHCDQCKKDSATGGT